MDAYATIDDLQLRWKQLNEDEKKKAEILLQDASYHLFGLLKAKMGDDFEIDETYKHNLKVVTCNIVMRSMNLKQDFFGVSQVQTTAGCYSESLTPINSTGDMRLTDEEERLLGLKKQKIGFISPVNWRQI